MLFANSSFYIKGIVCSQWQLICMPDEPHIHLLPIDTWLYNDRSDWFPVRNTKQSEIIICTDLADGMFLSG